MERSHTFRKTRLAPTPSGYLHLGNILSFAITAALAQKTGAKILLRIDDFDMQRTNKLYVQDIFDTLNFLELPWDEGPENLTEYEQEYSLLHRMDAYTKAIQQLENERLVFACTCTRTQVLAINADGGYTGTCRDKGIPYNTPNTSLRLRTDSSKVLNVKTTAGTTITATLPANMQDFIVRKKDGYPAYQLMSLLDDVHYGIDLIVRGEDLWPSTLSQIYLSSLLQLGSFSDTAFYHHPLLMGADYKKLSKSEGATSVHYLRKEGITRAEICSMTGKMVDQKSNARTWQEVAALLSIPLGTSDL